MKHIIITLKDITETGGGERVCVNLANALTEAGHRVEIISFFSLKESPAYTLNEGIKVRYLSKLSPNKNLLIKLFCKSLYRKILCQKIDKIIKDSKPQVVLANDGWYIPPKKINMQRNIKYEKIIESKASQNNNQESSIKTNTAKNLNEANMQKTSMQKANQELSEKKITKENLTESSTIEKGQKAKQKKEKQNKKSKSTHYIRLWHLKAPKNINKRKGANFACFDKIIILSKRELKTWQGYHHNVVVIPNFLPAIPTHNTDSSQKVVLSVGRLSAEKGFLRLIDIWQRAKIHKGKDINAWQLVIVGDGMMKEQIEQKIQEKNLQDSITLKPFTKDIEREYLQASIYVMASYFEGFSMVLAEASSYALPCIAFDIATGPSDIIESGVSGYLIEDDDLQGFADKITELMDNDDMRRALGRKAKERVSKQFSKESILPLWDEAFND